MYIEQSYGHRRFDASERVILDHIIENASSTTRSIGIIKFCARCTTDIGYLTIFRMLNILMLILGTVTLYVGYVLVSNYCMDSVYVEESIILRVFWPFYYLPWSLIGISITSLCISSVALMTELSRLHVFYFSYAIVLIVLTLTNFGCLFSALETEKLIEIGISKNSQEHVNNEVIKQFHQREEFRSAWNHLQIRLRCCGADRYDDFWNASKGENLYPDSCKLIHANNKQCVSKVSISKYM